MDQVSDKKNTDEMWTENLTILQAMKKLNEKEKEDLETIKGKGIPVVIQYVPTDAEEAY